MRDAAEGILSQCGLIRSLRTTAGWAYQKRFYIFKYTGDIQPITELRGEPVKVVHLDRVNRCVTRFI